MVVHYKNFISNNQIDELYYLWFESKMEHHFIRGNKYKLELINLTEKTDELKLEHTFESKYYNKLLLQSLDESHKDSIYQQRHHNHQNEWTSVIYLNDNYDGGEIEFKNGRVIKPSSGDMIYFSPNEFHRVLVPYNFKNETYNYNGNEYLITKRISLVSFLNKDVMGISNKSLL